MLIILMIKYILCVYPFISNTFINVDSYLNVRQVQILFSIVLINQKYKD